MKSKICLFCRFSSLTKRLIVFDNYNYNYYWCAHCQVWTIFPLPPKIKTLYGKRYFTKPKPPTNHLLKLILQFSPCRDTASWVKASFVRPGSVLDVGCGDGSFLETMSKLGWEVAGTDISSFSEKLVKEKKAKIKFYKNELHRINQLKSCSYKAITFWHVLEHLSNPKKDLQKSYQLLKNGGRVFIEVPNADSFALSLFQKNYNWLRIPEHLTYWTPKGIKKNLQTIGFKKIKVGTPPKATLNYAYSIKNCLKNKNLPSFIRTLLFGISIPSSVLITFFALFFLQGEALRVEAEKIN